MIFFKKKKKHFINFRAKTYNDNIIARNHNKSTNQKQSKKIYKTQGKHINWDTI